ETGPHVGGRGPGAWVTCARAMPESRMTSSSRQAPRAMHGYGLPGAWLCHSPRPRPTRRTRTARRSGGSKKARIRLARRLGIDYRHNWCQNGTMKRMNLRDVPDDVYAALVRAAEANRQSLSAF